MNDVLFNDTFDNFSFTTSGNFVEKKSEGGERVPLKNLTFETNISIDDSVFLSESFSFDSCTNFESFNESGRNSIGDVECGTDQKVDLDKKLEETTKQLAKPIENENTVALKVCSNTQDVNLKECVLSAENGEKIDGANKNVASAVKSRKIFELSVPPKHEQTKNAIEEKLDEPKQEVLNEPKPEVNFEEFSNLSSWGLPESILQKYTSRKVTKMFRWQVECLSNPNILEKNKNLVYSAPTSAGKTLVAEILAIKTVLERKKKVLFILPFVSVVREKMFYFQDILGTAGIRVEGFMGSYNPPGGFRKVQMAICTIEKANSLVNRLLEEGKLDKIGAVIVDEMHLIGDFSRGYLLELLLTKLRYMSLKNDAVDIQIVGMSATLPNLSLLAKWLDAELFTTSYRPIPLREMCHVKGEIYDGSFQLVRKLQALPELGVDADNVFQLCLETIFTSCSVLIFCPTKNWCENLAQQIATAFAKLGTSDIPIGARLREQINADLVAECLEQLKRSPVGLDGVLKKTVCCGVAFHHAGLTMDERDIIEGAFRIGGIRVLIATSTLSSGVNLPARRVIIRTPIFHGKPIDTLVYRQMIGRAGRMGKDTVGESILICQPNDRATVKELMSTRLQPIESCLAAGKLKRAILEVIASNVASTPEEISLFTRCTLLANNEDTELNDPIEESVKFLERNEFIRLQVIDDQQCKYVPTNLAKACLSSSLPPEEGLSLFAELEKARQCFVLETDLHLIYLVTPYSACNQLGNIDWMSFLEMWEKLPASMKRVGDLVGVKVSFIIGASRGNLRANDSKSYHRLQVHKRFYTALALQDLVNEVPLGTVASKFGCNRGLLQSLQQTSATFAGMVTAFSKQLGWSSVELLVSQFQDRLQFGVSRDLIDLMRLPLLNGQRARALFDAGIETLVDLANSDVYTLENVLHKAKPFESEKEREGESSRDTEQRKNLRTVWVTGMQGLTEREAAEMLIRDARQFLQYELGLQDAQWDGNKTESEAKTEEKNSSTKSEEECTIKSEHGEESFDGLPRSTEKSELGEESFHNSCEATDEAEITKENTNTSLENHKEKLELTKTAEHDRQKTINESSESLFGDSFTVDSKLLNEISGSKNNSLPSASFLEEDFDTDSKTKCKSSKEIDSSKNNSLPSSSFLEEAFDTDFETQCKTDKENIRQSSSSFKRSRRSTASVNSEDDMFATPPQKRTKRQSKNENCVMEIINVCEDKTLFKRFSDEITLQKDISVSIACEKVAEKVPVIGNRIINKAKTEPREKYTYKSVKVLGLSFCWCSKTVYYVDLHSEGVEDEAKLSLLKELFARSDLNVRMFDAKEQIKVLALCCKVDFLARCDDPKVGDWLLDGEGKEKSLQAMVLTYIPEHKDTYQISGHSNSLGSIALHVCSASEPRIRSSVECLLTWTLMKELQTKLGVHDEVYRLEMDCILILCQMELAGFAVNVKALEELSETLKRCTGEIETKAFQMAGRRFSFTSSVEVAKVLGMYRGKRISTNKQVLEQCKNPISDLIMQWRKINNTLTKMVYPLLRLVENGRVHGSCILFNSTGRVSMHEPNLQNMPRDFEFLSSGSTMQISCRTVFVAQDKHILVAADYCQLELRLLAHFSQDRALCGIMRSNEDVFKSVAAKWNNIPKHEVTDTLRQQAKQICYGIIYGIGAKTLAEQLCITEEEAMEFTETFHQKYPTIKRFVNDTIKKCRECGYVETLAGRRRHLRHINHENQAIKSQAERQAVNTTIQGSAADIAKKAMVLVEKKVTEKFKTSRNKPTLVLQLHDELLYEVSRKYEQVFAKILKKSMEECVHLSIPFPVKLKTGHSWGEMKELKL